MGHAKKHRDPGVPHNALDIILFSLRKGDLGYHGNHKSGYVVDMSAHPPKRVEPQEIFLAKISAWVRADGTLASFDRGRGYIEFLAHERVRIVKAVAAFDKRLGFL